MEHSVVRRTATLNGLGQALFENAPDPLLLVEPDSDRILDANAPAAQLVGLERDTLCELRLADLVIGLCPCVQEDPGVRGNQPLTAVRLASLQSRALSGRLQPAGDRNEEPRESNGLRQGRPIVELRSAGDSPVIAELTVTRADADGESVFLVVPREVAQARRNSGIERLFHDSPVSLWEFDWSGLRRKIRQWQQSGITDLQTWLEDHPERVAELAREARIVSVSRGTLRMFGAKDRDDFRDNLATIFRDDSLPAFRQHVLARMRGENRVEMENVSYTLQGERLYVHVTAVSAPGCEESWNRIHVSILNITMRKRAEMLQETQRSVLESLVTSQEIGGTLRILIEQTERQAPELKLAIFRLLPDQQTIALAEGGCVPQALTRLFDARHWRELEPLIRDCHVDSSASDASPAVETAQNRSPSWDRLFERLDAATLVAGFCDGCLEVARNALGVPLGLVLFLRSGSGPFRDYEKDVIASVRRLTAITLDHERDHQQIQLRTSELQSVFQAYPDVLLRLDRHGVIVEQFGGHSAGLLTLQAPELIGARIWNALPAGISDRLKHAVDEVSTTGSQKTIEFQHGQDSQVRSLEARIVRLAETGDLLAILRDVTALKRMEQALEYASERFQNLFESSPDAIFVESIDGVVLDVNPAACELLGMTRDELVGCAAVDLVPETQRAHVRETALEIQARRSVSFDCVCLTRDGREVPVDVCGALACFDGRPALLFHVRDATRRVQEEQQRREHERQMAHVSRLSLMGQFVAGIAHEIRQPLWSISTFADVAAEALQRPDVVTRIGRIRELSQKIVGEVRRVNEITSRMFSFARKSLPERESTVLQDVIEAATALCRPALADRGIPLSVDVPEASVRVVCDRVLIEQTLVNLITNASRAIDSVPGVSGRISVTLKDEGGLFLITVADNGCGLPEGLDAEQLFEGFFTTDRAGLGIGLALSRSFVEEHGGRIWAEENPGAGMSFHFTLMPDDGTGAEHT